MVTDALGDWQSLGVVEPSFTEWRLFLEPVVFGKIFRLNFTCTDWTKTGNAYMWLRYKFAVGGATTQARRIYPKQRPLIIEMPVPEEFETIGSVVRDLECLKAQRTRLGIRPAIPWLVEIEERIN